MLFFEALLSASGCAVIDAEYLMEDDDVCRHHDALEALEALLSASGCSALDAEYLMEEDAC